MSFCRQTPSLSILYPDLDVDLDMDLELDADLDVDRAGMNGTLTEVRIHIDESVL